MLSKVARGLTGAAAFAQASSGTHLSHKPFSRSPQVAEAHGAFTAPRDGGPAWRQFPRSEEDSECGPLPLPLLRRDLRGACRKKLCRSVRRRVEKRDNVTAMMNDSIDLFDGLLTKGELGGMSSSSCGIINDFSHADLEWKKI